MKTPALPALAMLACSVALAPSDARAQAMERGAPPESFGEFSYYEAYPRRDPDDLVDQAFWMTCWAFTRAEMERLQAAARAAPPELTEELEVAAAHYQVAAIYYSELVRGTAIHLGRPTSETNRAFETEQQALIGAGEQWLAENAADCIWRLPDRAMPEFAELYPWLAVSLGAGYRN